MANYFERKLSQETISSLTAILCHFNLEYCEYAEEIDTCFADMEHSENQVTFKLICKILYWPNKAFETNKNYFVLLIHSVNSNHRNFLQLTPVIVR